jgi:hypothetical protein
MTEKLNIFCLWVGNKYPVDYVIKLKNMLEKNVTVPYQFVCLTDRPHIHKIDGIKFDKAFVTIVDSWCKLSLFVPQLKNLGYSGKSLYLDLDVVIVANIDKIIEENDDFTIIQDWWRPTFNSSMMIWNIGNRDKLYMKFKKSDMIKHRGDQDHISEILAGDSTVKTFNPTMIQSYKANNLQNGIKKFTKIAVFHGKPKPHECEGWVKDYWQ